MAMNKPPACLRDAVTLVGRKETTHEALLINPAHPDLGDSFGMTAGCHGFLLGHDTTLPADTQAQKSLDENIPHLI